MLLHPNVEDYGVKRKNRILRDSLPGFLLYGTIILLVILSLTASAAENTEDQGKANLASLLMKKRLAFGGRFGLHHNTNYYKDIRQQKKKEMEHIKDAFREECCNRDCVQEEVKEIIIEPGKEEWGCEIIREDPNCKATQGYLKAELTLVYGRLFC